MSGPRLACSLGSIVTAMVVVCFFFVADASAGDYSVTYAIDANGKTDAGKVDSCTYSESCEIDLADLRVRMRLSVHQPDHRSVELTIYGPNGCCLSADAGDAFYIDVKPGLQRLPIYAGKRRQRNEYVLNERFGILYLEFSDVR